MQNKQTPHFFTWFYKDWMISGARNRLSIPARSIYCDLLGLVYVEAHVENDKDALMLQLGIPEEYSGAMDQALKEFEIDRHNRLRHPRVTAETRRTVTRKKAASVGGKASAAARQGK